MSCGHCNGTGSLQKDLYGSLDCPHCEAADERAALEKWVRTHAPQVYSIDAWAIYQHGKAAAHNT